MSIPVDETGGYRHLCRPERVGRAIAALAGSQHGVVTSAQLVAAGLSRDAVQRRLRSGRLHRVHRAVYAVGHPHLSASGRFLAAVLACGPGAVLSHASAAAAWGLRLATGGLIDVTVPTPRRAHIGIRLHVRPVADDERAFVDRIPVTTVARTLFDLAPALGVRGLERLAARAEADRLASPTSLAALAARHRGRHGAPAIRSVLARARLTDGATRSELEDRFLALVDAAGLPRPRLNHPIPVAGRTIVADAAWPAARVLVELDGYAHHGTREAFERDRERDREALMAGWTTVRATWPQVTDGRRLAADLTRLVLGGS